MRQFFTLLVVFSFHLTWGQGWVHNGAYVQNDSAYLVIEGNNPNYTATGNSTIKMSDKAVVKLQGNWVNNGNTAIFVTNDGSVILHGNAQDIAGTKTTSFPTLETAGAGTKTLQVNTLVGGGNGTGTGFLILSNGNILDVNSNRLIINNPDTNAISKFAGRGYVLGETNAATGYSEIEWRIRNTASNNSYVIPLGTNLQFQFDVNANGTSISGDTGSVIIATYPSNSAPAVSNRPLPTGVTNTNNEYGVENSALLVDRYWMLNSSGYSQNPDLDVYFNHYQNTNGTNTIDEKNLGAIRWNTGNNTWVYPVAGTSNTTGNYVLLQAGRNFSGIWTLSDTTPCPIVDFYLLDSCENLPSNFVDNSTIATGNITNWNWDFNYGNQATGNSVSTTYNTAGIYLPKLLVTASSGCIDSLEKAITIANSPIASFTYHDTCFNSAVAFQSTSTAANSSISNLNWDLGDGSNQNQASFNHKYASTNTYNVQLAVENTAGCFDTIIQPITIVPAPIASYTVDDVCEGDSSFFLDQSTTSQGSLSQWNWNINNTQTSTQQNVDARFPNAGNYTVTLRVANSFGCWDTIQKQALVNPRAIAAFDFLPQIPNMLEDVAFTNQSQNDDTWDWSFGDGSNSVSEDPLHVYNLPGSYIIQLIANNIYNCADTLQKEITVNSAPLYWIPSAFSPTETPGLNDNFGLNTPLPVKEYRLEIFNRWGEQIFASDDVSKRWDGTYNGQKVQAGSYLYILNFRDSNSKIFSYHGEVTIVR